MSESAAGLQQALKKLEKYCHKWQLTVNTNKTKILVFQGGCQPAQIAFYYKENILTEVKEFNFLGNIIDSKGKFKKSIQELSKKGLKALFSLRKYMSNFKHVPVDISCKLFDTLIRPVILYNSEVWFMDDYFSVFKSIQRSRANGTICDKLSLADKYAFEKIHLRFCRSILEVGKTASNFAVKAELGRLPLEAFIKTQVITFYSRINTQNINPFSKRCIYFK